jgi:hypothetical protein
MSADDTRPTLASPHAACEAEIATLKDRVDAHDEALGSLPTSDEPGGRGIFGRLARHGAQLVQHATTLGTASNPVTGAAGTGHEGKIEAILTRMDRFISGQEAATAAQLAATASRDANVRRAGAALALITALITIGTYTRGCAMSLAPFIARPAPASPTGAP